MIVKPIIKPTTAMSHHLAHSLRSLSNSNYPIKFFQPNSLTLFTRSSNQLGLYKPHCMVLQPHSSSSSSSKCSHIVHVSSSGAEFPGELLDDQEKRMKSKSKVDRIAGIEQDGLVDDPALLADPDSCFFEFRGVKLHHKVSGSGSDEKGESSSSRVGVPMILLHGFGASLFSWSGVMKCLALVVGSKVLAFDRPAFGLTSRSDLRSRKGNGGQEPKKKLNPYSTVFSVLATLNFIELLGAEKAILVGHSAGSFVAVKSYFEAPERVAALILVSPAILAPLTVQRGDNQSKEDGSNSKSAQNPFLRFFSALFKFARFLMLALTQVTKSIVDVINVMYRNVLKAFLQSVFAVALIRVLIDKFGIMVVKQSWYNSKLCTENVIAGYTKPLRAKGWDRALVEYTAALLTDTDSEPKPSLWQLREISCPVLIVTGDSDRIVPAWNAERLARAIPGSSFEVIKQCGHLPQEEKPDEFIALVQKFLQRTRVIDPAEQP